MHTFIQRYRRHLAFFFLLNIITQLLMPTVSLALTSGPSQPEVESFKPIDVADMVNPFTGDLSYNIPLLDVEGYPINLSYSGGSGMDAEATCVGLGWNINAGSISRGLRGLPDDFNGDIVKKEFNVKENETYGITLGVGGELFGLDKITGSISLGVSFNTYTGFNVTQKVGLSVRLGSVGMGLGVGSSSDGGLTLSPNISLTAKADEADKNSASGSVSLGTSINSRTGMKELSLSVGVSGPSSSKAEGKGKNNTHRKGNEVGSSSHSYFNNSSSISFGSPTWVPQITMPMKTKSIYGSFKIGGTIFGVDLTGDIAANYAKEYLATNVIESQAFGYLNLQNGQASSESMLDFNREKDATFTQATTNLPIPNLTYDNFSVMGQGVGGSYRAYRGEFGHVFDKRATTTSESAQISGDVGLVNLVDGGSDFILTAVNGVSGKWENENDAIAATRFKPSTPGELYEPAYFKEQGEMNLDDDALYETLHGEKAMRFNLSFYGNSTGLAAGLTDEKAQTITISNNARNNAKRVKRNQHFSYLTVGEAKKFGLQPSLYNSIDGVDHHMAEITTTKTDGTRYVYGLPVFNKVQKEATFNVGNVLSNNALLDPANNLVKYTEGTDNSTGNEKGVDRFYTKTETPKYAYAYMLTAVLSSDYIDRDNTPGPSDGDLGTYTLFTYSGSEKVADYKWRTPFPKDGSGPYANYDQGFKTNALDDKGSYIYGEKDIHYVSKIETKNYIALYTYSTRNDGWGVTAENGTINTTQAQAQKKLETITLYSKADYQINGNNAFIIKQVHFVYDYSLCQGVYNNNINTPGEKGKLTLKQVYFTYGNSYKAKLSPYRFQYNTTVQTNGATVTPIYSPGSVDRWGIYKPNDTNLPNSEFPYTSHVKAEVDSYAALWNLKSIQLPSGGLINIGIESDDYAYVQDKRAGQMFKIVAATDTPPVSYSAISSCSNTCSLYDGSAKQYLIFERQNAGDDVNEYFKSIKDNLLYFRFNIKTNLANTNEGYEYVNGYATIKDYGVCQDNNDEPNFNGKYGWIQLDLVPQEKNGNRDEHPISKAAWQFARLKTPREAYNEPSFKESNSGKEESVFRALAKSSIIKNAIDFFRGPNGALKGKGLGQNFKPAQSWVRLTNPTKQKLGGGYRVKEITISDKWDAMMSLNALSGNESVYGQRYSYTTTIDNQTISSGVAAYEPSMGADENPLRQPVYMDAHKDRTLLAPDNGLFIEEPLGESFYPSPQVGYAKVTISNINSGTGKTVNEYFTAKDFPCITHVTPLNGQRLRPDPIFSLFAFNGYDKFTGSQGYAIEINDMHGKPKAIHTFEEGAKEPTISTIYHYKTNGKKLTNEVPAIGKDGAIKYDTRIGVEFDAYADFRENTNTTEAFGIKGDLYVVMFGFFPGLIPVFIPSYHKEEVVLRTAVTNKVIYRYGIIDRIEKIENTNSSTTQNLLWDGETGEVLLSSTTTEFKDPIYAMKYPAHWAYQTAAGAYKNTGLIVPTTSIENSTGKIVPSFNNKLIPGDELYYIKASNDGPNYAVKLWVYKDPTNPNDLYLMDKDGKIVNTSNGNLPTTNLKVVRSGAKNLQSLNIGATTTFTNPLNGKPSNFPLLNQNFGVLNATAIQLGNAWQTFCQCDVNVTNGSSYNPYYLGIKGNLYKTKEYTYLATRRQTQTANNTNIRVDGTFDTFTPFWQANAGNDWTANTANWTYTKEATLISPYGNEHENQDALKRYSAAQFGYKQTKPVAIASNARYKQIANENFESVEECIDNHMGFKDFKDDTYLPNNTQKRQTYAHTGRRSIKVGAGGTRTIIKQLSSECSTVPTETIITVPTETIIINN